MLDHGTGSKFAQAQAVEVVAVHQALQGGDQQILVAVMGVHGVGAGKRNAVAADNRHAAGRGRVEAVVTHRSFSFQINSPRIWGLSPAKLRTSNSRRGPVGGTFHRATWPGRKIGNLKSQWASAWSNPPGGCWAASARPRVHMPLAMA